jgi:hypothetical protein
VLKIITDIKLYLKRDVEKIKTLSSNITDNRLKLGNSLIWGMRAKLNNYSSNVVASKATATPRIWSSTGSNK